MITIAIIDAPIIIAIGAVVVLLFGADRLPKLARAMGQAKREFDTTLHQPAPGTPPPSDARQQSPPDEGQQITPPPPPA